MKCRDFLKTTMLMTAAVAIDRYDAVARIPDIEGTGSSTNRPRLPRRPYGKTGMELFIIGLGGIVVKNTEQDHADRVVAEAVDRGVNYFDVAPTDGNAELCLGPALQPF